VPHDHVWHQIRKLLDTAERSVTLVAPFIKKEIFKAVLDVIPEQVDDITCVTRWSVSEIAAGVSDPEIFELAAADGRPEVRLCHNLHAKLFGADDRCLIGSANLTGRATGRVPNANVELLVEVRTSHPEVQRMLTAIDSTSVAATQDLALHLREQADLLRVDEDAPNIVVPGQHSPSGHWLPETRRPERLYQVYSGKYGKIGSDVLAGVLRDLSVLDIAPGLSKSAFKKAVRIRLRSIPVLRRLSEVGRLNMGEARSELVTTTGCTREQAQRAVETASEWLRHFDEVHFVPIGPWEIRQGKEIS
jgi:hypothetical protein